MCDRYILEIVCPNCGYFDGDCYYAPTCEIDTWECPICKQKVDLAEYSGISYEDASNAAQIEEILSDFEDVSYDDMIEYSHEKWEKRFHVTLDKTDEL